MSVSLVWITPNAEQIITDCARVSNPANQGKDGTALIKYLIKHDHWSPFEMACACFRIETSRGIAPQILRHRSFHFQEFSQRYAKVTEFVEVEPRRQDASNRQNSIDDLPRDVREWWELTQTNVQNYASKAYEMALQQGIAKECARFLLPASAKSVLYMQGTVRDWIHYVRVRTSDDTQLEHRRIAQSIRDSLGEHVPAIGRAVWGAKPL